MARSRLKKKNRQIPYEAKVIDKNILSATYFGFNPIKTPQIIKNDQTLFKIINDHCQINARQNRNNNRINQGKIYFN